MIRGISDLTEQSTRPTISQTTTSQVCSTRLDHRGSRQFESIAAVDRLAWRGQPHRANEPAPCSDIPVPPPPPRDLREDDDLDTPREGPKDPTVEQLRNPPPPTVDHDSANMSEGEVEADTTYRQGMGWNWELNRSIMP